MKKCKIQDKCGGCQLLHMSYQDTVNQKRRYVEKCFKKENINAKIDKVISASDPFKYRNKMIISFKNVKGRIVSGFYKEKSHEVIGLDECLMHSDIQNNVYKQILSIIKKMKIRAYDEDRRVGLLRYIIIREAVHTKEIMIVLVLANDRFMGRNNFIKEVKKIPEVKTIIQNINPRKTSIVLGDKSKVLYGKGMITDYLSGLKFNISAKSFYQVNPSQTEKLYNEVLKKASLRKEDVLIDAYSGIGTIGMILSKHVKEVISVESNKDAHINAIYNSKMNNINNCRFYNDDATVFIDKVDKNIDVIVLDPPRTGSTPKFLNTCVRKKPRTIIYVSCEASTLARDLKLLVKNYRITSVSIVDMFCYTKHIETVVCLQKI